jgi:flagellar biosynthesis/type III secretory pathway protein FliH
MGRVVKNARVCDQPYVINVPQATATPAATNGHAAEGVVVKPVAASPKASASHAVAAPSTPAIDWGALRAEASALIEAASHQAQQLVGEAGEHAKALVEDAATQVESINQQAHETGFQSGQDAGRHAIEQEMNEMLITMRGLVDMARAERHKIIETAEPEIVKLAMGIAERILHQQVSIDRDAVVEMTKAAMARLLDREIVTVRVNPADLERIQEHRDELLALGDVKNMRVIEDQRVDRGGVMLETEAGAVDARLSTQIAEARRVLRIEDDVVVSTNGVSENGVSENGHSENGVLDTGALETDVLESTARAS